MSRRTWTVTELIREVNTLLEQGFSGILVEGELTNSSTSARGHLYFTLKDEAAAVDCVMWASRAARLRFEAEDGLAVTAGGSLSVYPQRGRFQLVVESLEPQGIGALQLAFEQLKKRLAAEGLFDDDRKRPLPALPSRVGIVSSLGGAALQDMLKVLCRFPHLEVVVAPAAVQGDGAAAAISDALARLGASGLVDLIIVGRGGGSLEDLWAFNEEPVARAIAASPVPVIAGVGHEVDFTIADFVADLRAATPTRAAELVVAQLERQLRRIDDGAATLKRDIRRIVALSRSRLHGLAGSSGLAKVPQRVRLLAARLERAERLRPLLDRLRERAHARLAQVEGALRRLPARVAAGGHRRVVESLRQQLVQLMDSRIKAQRALVAALERGLRHLSPTKVLERGYSITTLGDEATPLRDASKVKRGQSLTTTLARGRLRSIVADAPADAKKSRRETADQRSLFDDSSDGEPG